MRKQAVLSVAVFLALVGAGAAYRVVNASDHDDGEHDAKSRALNLTDHFVWKDKVDATKINFVQYSNPRSLPGYPYFFSTQARYEMHVTRVANKASVPTGADDIVFRFEFGAADATTQTQAITFTVLEGGSAVGSDATAKTTSLASARAGSDTAPTVSIGGKSYKIFAGLRADSFFFDVVRFFQVRSFLANAMLLSGNPTAVVTDFATNYKNCAGRSIGDAGGDAVNLMNPASCAPDFTKNYNVLSIALQTDITALGTETTFDTWSTISIPQ